MPDQCAYKEGRRRCRRNGTGNPPLCAAHRTVIVDAAASAGAGGVQQALHELMSNGRVSKKTLERALGDVLAGFGIGVGGATFTPPAGMNLPPNWRERMHTAPPPPPIDLAAERRKRAVAEARRTLGFGPGEVVTEEAIKARKRELAKRYHPDRGGDPSQMARVNDAADVLLKAV